MTLGKENAGIGSPPTQAEVQVLRDACEELAEDVRALVAVGVVEAVV